MERISTWGPAAAPSAMGMKSQFKQTFPEKQHGLKPGQKMHDTKMIEDVCLLSAPISTSANHAIRDLMLSFLRFRVASTLRTAKNATPSADIYYVVNRKTFSCIVHSLDKVFEDK